MQRAWVLLLLVQAAIAWAQEVPAPTQHATPATLPASIKPNDPRLYLIGRFVVADEGALCQWSHSQVRIRFRGTHLQARTRAGERVWLQVEVDGKPASAFHVGEGERLLDLATNLPEGEHEVAIVKRTEAHSGVLHLLSFHLNAGGELLEPRRMTRAIEIIGDGVATGYGCESTTPSEGYLPEHQNAYMSFGAIAGRELGAEVSCVGWSGDAREVFSRYEQVLIWQPEIKWQFTPQPNAILVMGNTITQYDEQYIRRLKGFVQRVRQRNPGAMIYLTTSPVISDNYPPGSNSFTKMRDALQKLEEELADEGDPMIGFLEFPTQDERDGLGGGYNPTIATHQKMAAQLVERLREDLKWDEVDVEQ